MKKKQIIVGLGLLILAAILLFVIVQEQKNNDGIVEDNNVSNSPVTGNEPPLSEPKVRGEQITIEAEGTCLLHRDSDGPQTMECAMGVKTNDGTYYAIKDETADYAVVSKIQTGKRSRITGTLMREESSVYQSSGTLTVSSVEDI